MELVPADVDCLHLRLRDLGSFGIRFPSISQHTFRPVFVLVEPISLRWSGALDHRPGRFAEFWISGIRGLAGWLDDRGIIATDQGTQRGP